MEVRLLVPEPLYRGLCCRLYPVVVTIRLVSDTLSVDTIRQVGNFVKSTGSRGVSDNETNVVVIRSSQSRLSGEGVAVTAAIPTAIVASTIFRSPRFSLCVDEYDTIRVRPTHMIQSRNLDFPRTGSFSLPLSLSHTHALCASSIGCLIEEDRLTSPHRIVAAHRQRSPRDVTLLAFSDTRWNKFLCICISERIYI